MPTPRPIRIPGHAAGEDRFPMIITPLVGRSPEGLLAEAAAIVPKAPDMLEWRIDHFERIGDVACVVDTAQALRRACGGIPVLLTRRNATEGGQPLAIDEAAVERMYTAACEARCVELIDCEMSNDRAALARLRAVSAACGLPLILSFHDFQRTPDDATLDARFDLARALGGDVAKVAVMPRDPDDVLRLLAATRRASARLDMPVVSMSMGAIGSISRMIGWVYGSAATFAVGQSASAPGQLSIEDLRAVLDRTRRAVQGS